jgi:hypothetical protein
MTEQTAESPEERRAFTSWKLAVLDAMSVDPEVTDADFRVAFRIMQHVNSVSRIAWPSVNRLAVQLKKSCDSIMTSTKRLCAAFDLDKRPRRPWLTKSRPHKRAPNHYQFLADRMNGVLDAMHERMENVENDGFDDGKPQPQIGIEVATSQPQTRYDLSNPQVQTGMEVANPTSVEVANTQVLKPDICDPKTLEELPEQEHLKSNGFEEREHTREEEISPDLVDAFVMQYGDPGPAVVAHWRRLHAEQRFSADVVTSYWSTVREPAAVDPVLAGLQRAAAFGGR